jgi:hypothetical protein
VNGSWGYFLQGVGGSQEIDLLGSKLSVALHCAVHYPAFNKRLFECTHGIVFPMFMVKGATESGNWEMVLEQHKSGYRPESST